MEDVEWEENVKEIFDDCLALMRKKRNDYGTNNITRFGMKGVLIRVNDKFERLINLIWEEKVAAVKDERTEDTLRDLANYAIIMLFLMKHGEW